ncbi:hypothetical protein HPB49_020685 [Dermacentor silvarum]|uniref:Uncharacterized protein n=1 Tax=Dermacentor silvarum TaxID=543639 RepID=A0ACB8DKH4_DERSI|nr:hypothetical protein HPB49_020685 [Dermacentor silvarum]
MIHHITNPRRGFREKDVLRILQALIVSRLTYHLPYHNLTLTQTEKIDVLLRMAVKAALGLPPHASTRRLVQLVINNSITELLEAQRNSQLQCLRQTRQGCAILSCLGYPIPEKPTQVAQHNLAPNNRALSNVAPIPRNMNPHRHAGRRRARVQTMTRVFGDGTTDLQVLYTNAALYPGKLAMCLAVIDNTNTLVACATLCTTDSGSAEEGAIALAIVHASTLPSQDAPVTIVTNSQAACRAIVHGLVAAHTHNILSSVSPSTLRTGTDALHIGSVIFHSSGRIIDWEWPEFYQNRSVKVPGTDLLRFWIISVQIFLFFVDFLPTPGWPGPPGLTNAAGCSSPRLTFGSREEELSPQEFEDDPRWSRAIRARNKIYPALKQAPASDTSALSGSPAGPGKPAAPPQSKSASPKLKKHPPLPRLPATDFKIVFRPRGGLNLRLINGGALLPILCAGEEIDYNQARSQDKLRINPQNNSLTLNFYGAVYSCHPFKAEVEACFNCPKPGHRADVCPKERTGLCPRCGIAHPIKPTPDCTPKWILCGGAHFTGTRRCKVRFDRSGNSSNHTVQIHHPENTTSESTPCVSTREFQKLKKSPPIPFKVQKPFENKLPTRLASKPFGVVPATHRAKRPEHQQTGELASATFFARGRKRGAQSTVSSPKP